MVKQTAKTSSFNQRSSLLTVFLLLLFAIIVVKLFDLQFVRHSEILQMADAQHNIYQKLLPSRGEIDLVDNSSNLDTVPLAANTKSYLVYAVPQDIVNPNLTATGLATVLQLDPKDVLSKITDLTKKYVPIKRALTDQEQATIKSLALPGIYFDSEDTRIYPQDSLLSQTVGFVGYKDQSTQKVGLYGLERYFQKDLAGSSGSLQAQGGAGGGLIFGATTNEQPAVDGANLILTVDKTIQFEAESVLQDAVTKNGADSGSLIVADPKTGKILAIANYPDFDPNQFNQVTDPSVFNNEAVTENYEPGSTFKAITMAAALDENKVTPTSTFTDFGFVNVDNYTIKNALPGARGVQTMTQVIDYSLNTGAIYAENQLGNPDFLKYVKAFGFGQRTGIELPETTGDLSGLNGNIAVNYDTASFGQGITVTPIQMLQAYMALANGGKMMKPYLVQSEIYSDGTTKNTSPTVVGQVVSPNTASEVSAMLVDDVENGEGKKAGVPGYYVAGKTGTAQVAGPDGKYVVNDNIGSFAGYAPAENPQFVMLIRIDHPRDVDFAESTAAPAWGTMAQFILNYMHIAPTRPVTGK
jgi:cell division protein FtsI/penicillin-binding protein 2